MGQRSENYARGSPVAGGSKVSSANSAATRLANYNSRGVRVRDAESDSAAAIIPYLAVGAYHLPGNTWYQDWYQFFANNHLIFGLFFHHKLHPISKWKRIAVLIGSIACGLIIANLLYLYFLRSDLGIESEVISVDIQLNTTWVPKSMGISKVKFTYYQATLWTLGASIHSLFDLSVWHLAACAFCRTGGSLECLKGCLWMGNYLILVVVAVTAAVASLFVVLRATVDSNPDIDPDSIQSGGLFDDEISLRTTPGPEAYRFLIPWCIGMLINWFVYYIILGTILFSGILGCYRLPILGGRPREVTILEEKQQAQMRETSFDEEYGGRRPRK
jgi:hypothetical protein